MEMDNRDELGKFYQEHYKTGCGAEIGVHVGDFSKKIAENWKGKILCVDIWLNEGVMEQAADNLKGLNCDLIKKSSVDAAKDFIDECLDWVYIDSDHGYGFVKEDIESWFPKVRKGGVVSGHDYIKARETLRPGDGVPEVWMAVDEFCEKNNYKVELVHDHVNHADFASWWFIK